MIWLFASVLALLVLALLLRPLWRARPDGEVDAPEVVFYRDQLAEIERDAAHGTLTEEEAKSARLEVQRRLLAVATPAATASPADAAPALRGGRLALVLPLVAVLVAGSLALYLEIGSPGAVTRLAGAGGSHIDNPDAKEFTRLVEQLQTKLKENPRDTDGWLLLARSLRTLDRLTESAEAYMRALALSGGRPDIASTYGEVMIEIAEGTVTQEALGLFRQALARDPSDPRARFYVGLARAQSGDNKGAIEDWSALVRDSPADAPWLRSVRAQIAETAQLAGIAAPQVESRPAAGPPMGMPPMAQGMPPGGAPPHPPMMPPVAQGGPMGGAPPIPPGAAQPGQRGPSQADMAAAAQMSPEDRQQMIRGMVDGLASRLKDNPNDVDGWLRLARAYGVLGEPDKSREALGEAAKQAPQRIDVLTQYSQALFTPEKAADKPPQEFVAVMRQILALEPTNAQALWYVGNELAATGDKQQAAQLFKRLLERLPPNAPLRPQVQRQLEIVQGG